MLIETPYKLGDTVTIKLSSGEELVGRLESENDDAYSIKTPLTLVMAQQGLGMQPYLFTAEADQKITFAKRHVTVITKTGKQFADAYQKNTSGLVTAPAGLSEALKV